MFKSFLETIKILFGLTEDTQKNKTDIKTLQAKNEALSFTVQQIASDVVSDRRIAAEQRENLILRLENILLKSEQRALPPGSNAQESAELQAQIDALKVEVETLRKQVEELKKGNG